VFSDAGLPLDEVESFTLFSKELVPARHEM
jgi:hypothetical protein